MRAPISFEAQRREGDPGIPLALLATTMVGLTGWLTVALRRSGFLGTDFLSLGAARREGLSFDYLASPVFGHFVPGHRLGNWLVESVAPLNFGFANVVLLACFALSLLVLHRVLAELFRPGPAPLLLTLFFGVSAIQVGTAQWWAAGLSRLPAGLFGLVAILLHLRYRREGRAGLLVGSVVAVGLAMAFSEDAALLLVLLVALRVLVLHPEEPLVDSIRAAVAEWKIWLLYLIPIAVSLLGSTTQTDTLSEFNSLGDAVRYIGSAWFHAFVPVVLGQFVNDGPLTPTEVGVVVMSQAALVALVAWTVVRRPEAWRAWLFFAIGFVVTQLPVASIRTGFFEPEHVAHQYRYYSVTLVFFTIALAAAVLPVRGTVEETTGRSDSRLPSWPALVAMSLVGAVYVAGSVWTSVRVADEFPGRQAGPYMETLQDELQALGRSTPEFTLLDGEVPEDVIQHFLVPDNRLRTIVPLVDPDISLATDGPALHRATDDGHLEPITFTVQQGGPALGLFATLTVGVLEAPWSVEDGQLCVQSGERPALIGYRPPVPVGPGNWHLRVRYRTDDTSFALVLVEQRGVVEAAPEEGFPITGDRTEATSALGSDGFSAVFLHVQPNVRFCLSEVALALVEVPGGSATG
ncbi:MAG: hypothetical protein ABR540_17305 [Acidimicrobiales bacterium]